MIKLYIAIASVFVTVLLACASLNVISESASPEGIGNVSSAAVREPTGPVNFTVRIENVSDSSSLATPFSPGIFIVHENTFSLFSSGEADRGMGLEDLAEDGNPAVLAENITAIQTGVLYIPKGEAVPGPLFPGVGVYEFSFSASSGARLSFALMLVQSNDLFFAAQDMGIDLFPNGQPLMGNITAYVQLWDAGTEVNEAPRSGPNQLPRQRGPNTGPRENAPVMQVNDGFRYPAVDELIRVTIEPLL